SGLDLAMKVVDLQEAGAAVLAFDYGGSLREQVTENETGFLFRTADDLAQLLSHRIQPISPISTRTNVWSEEWSRTAAHYFPH
ncbi:MAG TPA: hypothetical protein VHC72_14715, partial [Bryobacteraceae bacterium]|nr:hypothetical protein [Bryobacteraceae bacterium]